MSLLKLYRRVQAWRTDERTIRELLSRTDHELSDIGLLRGDVVNALKRR